MAVIQDEQGNNKPIKTDTSHVFDVNGNPLHGELFIGETIASDDVEEIDGFAHESEIATINSNLAELDTARMKSTQLYTHNVASVTTGTVYSIGNLSDYLPSGKTFIGIIVQGSGGAAAFDFCTIGLSSSNMLIFRPSVSQQNFQIKFRVLYTG